MSKTIEVVVPDVGDFSDIPVIEVLVKEGQQVTAEQSLVTLESDKATMEVPSPSAGVIQALGVCVNDTVSEGDVIAILELSEDETADELQDQSDSEPSIPDSNSTTESGDADLETPPDDTAGDPNPDDSPAQESTPNDDVVDTPSLATKTGSPDISVADPSNVPYASPAIRLFARELGVNLLQVTGTGKKGRILREDVAGFVKVVVGRQQSAPAKQGVAPGFDFPPIPDIDFSRFGEIETRELSRIQKISGANLHRNWVSIPHVTQHDDADITDMEAFRKSNAQDAIDQGFKLTPLVFLIKATVAALKKFPRFNSSLDKSGENLVLKRYFNIGIAVDTPQGLIVPVIRDCDRKGIMDLARELADVSARARDRKLKPLDLQGGCFSISSLGGIGGTGFSPIINAPEVAILGVSRSQKKPVWDGEEFKPRLILPISLSYDHRVIDGAMAARFTRYLASRLEDLRRLTL